MAFIRTIPPAEAEGPVREMYDQTARRFGFVPNWAQAFSLRPGVRDGWNALLGSITANLPVRTYELATLAAARAIRSSYCALAHGGVLAEKVFDPKTVAAIAAGADRVLEPKERAMMAFAEKVALDADRPRATPTGFARTVTPTRKSSTSPRPRPPGASSASCSTRWVFRPTRASTTPIRHSARR